MPLVFWAKVSILLCENLSIYLCQNMSIQSYLLQYNEVAAFIERERRNPSRHRIEEHDMLKWFCDRRLLDRDWPGSFELVVLAFIFPTPHYYVKIKVILVGKHFK